MITVTTNAEGVITGWAEVGGLAGGIQIELDEIPDDLAMGYYRLVGSSVVRDDELYRVYKSKQVPCPSKKSRTELLEEENALLALELAQTQLRFEQAEQEHAALLLELVSKGVI